MSEGIGMPQQNHFSDMEDLSCPPNNLEIDFEEESEVNSNSIETLFHQSLDLLQQMSSLNEQQLVNSNNEYLYVTSVPDFFTLRPEQQQQERTPMPSAHIESSFHCHLTQPQQQQVIPFLPSVESSYELETYNFELSKIECLKEELRMMKLSNKAKIEVMKADNQDVYSKIYFAVDASVIEPQRISDACKQIYYDELSMSENVDIVSHVFHARRRQKDDGQVPHVARRVWIPCTISKSIGQEKYNLFSSDKSLCGMINFRSKGAWKRKSSLQARESHKNQKN